MHYSFSREKTLSFKRHSVFRPWATAHICSRVEPSGWRVIPEAKRVAHVETTRNRARLRSDGGRVEYVGTFICRRGISKYTIVNSTTIVNIPPEYKRVIRMVRTLARPQHARARARPRW